MNMRHDYRDQLNFIEDMLIQIPNERKLFAYGVYEIIQGYMERNKIDEQRFETILLPILTRIIRVTEFGIIDLFEIIDEVRIGVNELKYNDDIDVEAEFCSNYANNKIIELQNKNK